MPRDLRALSTTTGSPSFDRHGLLRLLHLLWPRHEPGFRLRLAVTIALLAGAALLNALVPLLFAAAIDHLSADHAALAAPLAILVGYVLLQWLARVLNESRWALYGPIDQRLQRRLALRAIEHLHGLSLRFHLGRRTGEISRILDNGLKGLREFLFDAIFLILPFVAEIIFVATALLWRVDPVFAGILLATLMIYGTVLVIGSEWLRAHQRRAVARGAAAHGQAVDSLLNYETIKYFNREQLIAHRYDYSLAEVEELTVKSLRFRSTIGVVLVTVIASGMAAMLLLATLRVGAGAMTIGGLVLVNTYLLQLIRPMERLGQLYRSIKQSLVDLEQLLVLLDERPDVVDRPGARPLRPGPGAIAFEHVSFHYGTGRGTLADVSFTVEPGRKVAIVGPTGAGKSSIARLLFRFYDPSAGRILIDGQDVRQLTQASVRAAIAVVPQEAVLFNDTIGENIALARPDAGPAEIDAAAAAAALKSFIDTLPDGYATLVGERGLASSSSTRRPRRSTARPNRPCRPISRPFRRAPPPSSSRTGCPASYRPTRSWCSIGAASSSAATTRA
jgi:ATP-binding cassette, subfamily B, heavy metal transporter